MRKNYVVAFFSAAVVSGLVTSASVALGGRNVPAFDCVRVAGSATLDGNRGYYTPTQSADLTCPYPEMSQDRKKTVTAIWLYASDNSTTAEITASVCSRYYSGGAWDYMNCSATRSGTASGGGVAWTGHVDRVVFKGTDLDAWTNSSFTYDLAYLYVKLPTNARFRGYATDPF